MFNKLQNLYVTCNLNKDIEIINSAKLIAGKGIEGDRFCLENNDERSQLSLIQSENIDYYNKKFNTNFSYIQFRRNLITKDIELNDLVGKKLIIGDIEPNITFILDINPEIGLKRTSNRGDNENRFENYD